MDELNRNHMPETENEVPAEPAVEAKPVEPAAEPDVEATPVEPAAEPAREPTPEIPPQPQWQGGYTYQAPGSQGPEQAPGSRGGYTYRNPNPYQNVGGYPYPPMPKKQSNKGLIIVAGIAASMMLICCGLIVAAIVFGFNGSVSYPDLEGGFVIDEKEETQEKEDSGSNSQREEGAVYNMPEITKEEKTGEELSLVDINKKVKNSVVGILIAEQNAEDVAFSGSGFIISQDGYIMTNDHVIEGSAKVKVVLSDGITEYDAVIVGEDERSDLAILKIEATGLQPAELGDSDQLEVGETVVAIGNPYGMELAGTVTDGIVSALNRKIEMNGSFMTLIQTNASINPGNSGGPLVNAYGQVIGITSSKLVATDYEGIGFAIPINHAVSITEELITYGYIKTRAYIGIQGSDLTAAYAKYHNLPQGVYVSYVDPECDAAAKGLQEDDVIIGFNGKEITSMAELNDLKDSFHPGDQVTIKVWRDGEEFEITITLTEASQ